MYAAGGNWLDVPHEENAAYERRGSRSEKAPNVVVPNDRVRQVVARENRDQDHRNREECYES